MTFRECLTAPSTGPLLKRLLEDNRRVDAERDARRIREQNEAIYLTAIRAWLGTPTERT